MKTILRVCPCVLLSELNDRGIVASCEIDLCSAITMRAMALASENLRHASIGTIITERRKIRLYFSIVGPSRRA